jgi:hypothetical protein
VGSARDRIRSKVALFSASALGIASALTARRWSIDFSAEVSLDPDPLPHDDQDPYLPEAEDGPITTAIEIEVTPETMFVSSGS